MIHVYLSFLPESTEYVNGRKLYILNLVDLVAHVLKILFHLAPVSSLQTLHFSPSTHSHEHICVNLCNSLQISVANIAELFNCKGAM